MFPLAVELQSSCFSSVHQRKLARLIKYLQFRDYKSKLLKSVEDEEMGQEPGDSPTWIKIPGRRDEDVWLMFVCVRRCSWWEPAEAAAGAGLPGMDGSDRGASVVGGATGSRSCEAGEDGGQRSPGKVFCKR